MNILIIYWKGGKQRKNKTKFSRLLATLSSPEVFCEAKMHQVYFWQVFGRSRTPLGILRRSPAPWSAGDGLHPPIRQRTGRIRRLVLGAYGASTFASSTDDVSTRARLAMSRRASRNRGARRVRISSTLFITAITTVRILPVSQRWGLYRSRSSNGWGTRTAFFRYRHD